MYHLTIQNRGMHCEFQFSLEQDNERGIEGVNFLFKKKNRRLKQPTRFVVHLINKEVKSLIFTIRKMSKVRKDLLHGINLEGEATELELVLNLLPSSTRDHHMESLSPLPPYVEL